ncbi:MAG TPA: hypothetical protein VN519_07825 [Bryobacteraceae bacterium]|nr:hypothetical protein [Bryobacteraceae bacterium]
MKIRAFAIFALSLPCALHAQEGVAFPTPESLITRAGAAAQAQSDRNWQYTYREDHTQSQVDKHGKPSRPETRTYEHIMLEGSEYKKLVLIDGLPLDPKTRKKVDADLEKARAERRRSLRPSLRRSVSLGSLELLLRLFDNKVTRREIINGRPAWKVESEPKSGIKAASRQEEEMLATRRTNWFDEQDGYRFHEHIEFERATRGVQPGTVLDLLATRVGEQWLQSDATIRASMKAMFISGTVESHQHFYDYKRFQADSTFTPQ